jgi:hypothetical protein
VMGAADHAARMGAGPLIQGRELWLMLRYLGTVAGDPRARANRTDALLMTR